MTFASEHVVRGSWTPIVGESCWALVGLSEDDPRVVEARRAIASESPLLAVVEAFARTGVGAAPGFVVVGRADDEIRFVVRRPGALIGTESYDGVDALTWVEGVLPAAARQPGTALELIGGAGSGALSLLWEPDVEQGAAEELTPAARYAVLAAADTGVRDELLGRLTGDGASRDDPPSPTGNDKPAPGADRHTTAVWDDDTATTGQPEGLSGSHVLAVRCESGHLAPPTDLSCRTCGAAISRHEPFEAMRPPLGRLVFSSGNSVLLDKDVVIGRAPRSDETSPAARPNLVRLTDSDEISRMHVSVRLEGWKVIVRDLGSANGTAVTTPAGRSERLAAGGERVITPGSVVALADVVTFTYEAGV